MTGRNSPARVACACTGECGDDPNVQSGRVLGCTTYRAVRNPHLLHDRAVLLRMQVQALVDLMDRLEPDVPECDRASDEEWVEAKAEAKRLLAALEL